MLIKYIHTWKYKLYWNTDNRRSQHRTTSTSTSSSFRLHCTLHKHFYKVRCHITVQTSACRARAWCVYQLMTASAISVTVAWHGRKHEIGSAVRICFRSVQSSYGIQTVRCSSLNVMWRRRKLVASVRIVQCREWRPYPEELDDVF